HPRGSRLDAVLSRRLVGKPATEHRLRPEDALGRGEVRAPSLEGDAMPPLHAVTDPSPGPPSRSDRNEMVVWTGVALAALALLVYLPAFGNGWALDDIMDILENRFVTGPFDPLGIFGSEDFGGWGYLASGHYRPLLVLTYATMAKIF